MIAFAITNWRWLLPTAAAALLGIWLGFTKIELADLKTAVAEADKIATQKARAADALNAQLAAAIDQAYLERHNAQTEAADAARSLARSRGLYVRGKCNLPGTATDPRISESGTTEVRLDAATSDALITIARDGDRAALYAQSCHDWAVKVGK